MTRKEARALLGNQPKWALRNMARALQMMTRLNQPCDWRRLEALRALGYKVTCEIPGAPSRSERAQRAKAFSHATARHVARQRRIVAMGQAAAAEYIKRHGLPLPTAAKRAWPYPSARG